MKVEAVEEISKTEGGASHFSQFAFLFSFHTTVAALIETLWDQSVSDHILSPNTLTTIVSNYFFFFLVTPIWRSALQGNALNICE